MTRTLLVCLASISTFICACADEKVGPPTVEKKPFELELHGDTRVDDYYWLKERENEDVIAYLEAENLYTDSVLVETSGLRNRLIDEMKSRIVQDDSTAPYKHGDYYYYTRFEEGLDYPIYCRRLGSMDAEEEILLDINKEGAGEEYVAVRGFAVSPNHKLAVYGLDTVGRRFYDLRILDLETGMLIAENIENVTANFRWANDNKTIFYTRQDPETLRWDKIFRHETGSEQDDELIYEEKDDTFSSYVYRSTSGNFIYVASQSTVSTDVRYVSADSPTDPLQLIRPREVDHEYSVTDGGDRFYILSNENAQNFQLLEAPLDNTAKEAWSVVVAHRDDVLLEYVNVFADYMVLTGMQNGLTIMEVVDRISGETYQINFGESVYQAYSSNNYEYDADVFRYGFESMTTPDSVYDYDLVKREGRLVKQKEIPGGYDPNNYQSERIFVEVRDGTEVPVSLVYRKGMDVNGQNPLLQYGYGSYGANVDPGFSSNLPSLLDRGFIYAIAHIRGSSTMGRDWYYDGRQLNKKNTFTDFIDVSKFLIDEKYTSPEHLYAMGGSAGGLLMGAVVNMAPELYKGVLSAVPFVDVITTMIDPSIPLTSGEWNEWGDPREKEFYDYMLSYSPYDQVARQDYPNILVTTGLHDSQVQYWEPAKWVAKLREYKTDDNLLLLQTNMSAGHGGKTGRFQRLEDAALYYTFFLYLEGGASE